MTKFAARKDWTRTAITAYEAGAEVKRPGKLKWNVAGKCSNPVYIEHDAYDRAHIARSQTIRMHRYMMEIEARCRKCPSCLRARAALWRHRAQAECAKAERTWFATLTLSPERQFYVLNAARAKLANRQIDFDALGEAERFAWRCNIVGAEITRYLKRVRKTSKSAVRYIVVAEKHKTGDPHFHALIHQCNEVPVLHKVLSKNWTWGFSKFNLCTSDREAAYVCKYLSKDAMARVRASQFYGIN